jgi:hypothetical protein
MVTSIVTFSGTYTGEWNNNRPHGAGTFTVTQGARANNGYGVVSGHIYSGNFVNGFLEGHGTITANSSPVYEGNFVRGLQSGQGTSFSRGTHTGEFRNALPNGQGRLVRWNGDIFEGEFKDGDLPRGKITFAPGSWAIEYEGDLLNLAFHGQGLLYWANPGVDGVVSGEGEFRNGRFINGKMIFADGSSSEGEFNDEGHFWNGVNRDANGEITSRMVNGVWQPA